METERLVFHNDHDRTVELEINAGCRHVMESLSHWRDVMIWMNVEVGDAKQIVLAGGGVRKRRVPERAVRNGDVIRIRRAQQDRAQAEFNDLAVRIVDLHPVADSVGALDDEDDPGDEIADVVLDGETDGERRGA